MTFTNLIDAISIAVKQNLAPALMFIIFLTLCNLAVSTWALLMLLKEEK
jgi:hypothetical protein